MTAETNKAVIRRIADEIWNRGALSVVEEVGLPPTGIRIEITGITIYRFAGAKVAEAWEPLDLLGMWRQLSVFRPPGH